ncbi:mCG121173, isoform CRA_a, partial [Mus musculus]
QRDEVRFQAPILGDSRRLEGSLHTGTTGPAWSQPSGRDSKENSNCITLYFLPSLKEGRRHLRPHPSPVLEALAAGFRLWGAAPPTPLPEIPSTE